ncbi:MAG: copper chaperone PCu(A)C [Rhodobacteraceae bacterium]|nr:MAG: copper chaperone PCu(A)C [Paracoccaceae bacterium]
MASAAYMSIANTGETADRLIDARAPIARRVEIHTHIMEDGVAKMRRIEGVEIAAGETVTLEPGGLHVMLMGLTGPMDDGDLLPLTLVFEQAGEIAVAAPVIALRPRAASHGHAGH